MRDIGYVTRGLHEGKETIGIRLTWDKRYITLAPKATLLGLAFRLFDPENLLGRGEDIGITLALDPDRPSRRRDRPPASAVGRRVPQRPELGQRRVHSRSTGSSAARRWSGRAGAC